MGYRWPTVSVPQICGIAANKEQPEFQSKVAATAGYGRISSGMTILDKNHVYSITKL